MAKRGPRRRANARRYPNGRIRHRDDPGDYRIYQRLRLVAGGSAANYLATLAIPPVQRTREQQSVLQSTTRAVAKQVNLSFPVGVAYTNGLFRWKDDRCEEHDGIEYVRAADHYAALHRIVWGSLPAEVEERINALYGDGAYRLLLQVGRVKLPARPMSPFRNLIPEEPAAAPDSLSLEQIRQRRWRTQARYWEAREELQRVSQRALIVVDDVAVSGIDPRYLRPVDPSKPLEPAELADQEWLRRGLHALARKFGMLEA